MTTIKQTRTMTGTGLGPTVQELHEFIEGLHDDTTVVVRYSHGHQLDPSQWTLEVDGTGAFTPRPIAAGRRNGMDMKRP